jgi:hypothetical protein
MTTKSEQILAVIDHLYWFKDMLDEENKKDFLKSIKKLISLISND